MSDPLDGHYSLVLRRIIEGDLVPFLGAGANMCGRPENESWSVGHYLPSGGELAAFLAKSYDYPVKELILDCPTCHTEVRGSDRALDLLRVAQFVGLQGGEGDLYKDLHKLFNADYPPTSLHQFLATLPAALVQKGFPKRGLLVVTTNYDDLMERAFKVAGEPFDILAYVAKGDGRGTFLHWPPDGPPRPITEPNRYTNISLDERSVVLKIHGAVNRTDHNQDSYVIREDDYIDYLARTSEINGVLPVTIVDKLKNSHLLFLGYSLSDWNLRVILHRIWEERKFDFTSWAVQLRPEPLDQQFWSKRAVNILDVRLEEYIKALAAKLQSLPAAADPAPPAVPVRQ
jgi:hypothetical protein